MLKQAAELLSNFVHLISPYLGDIVHPAPAAKTNSANSRVANINKSVRLSTCAMRKVTVKQVCHRKLLSENCIARS